MTIDLLPTFAHLAGARLPDDRIIDGRDITPLLLDQPGARSPHEAFYFYWGLELARRPERPLEAPPAAPLPGPGERRVAGESPASTTRRCIELALFDLQSDPAETSNVAGQHPDVVQRLEQLAEAAREDLGDAATRRTGKNVRAPGRLSARSEAKEQAGNNIKGYCNSYLGGNPYLSVSWKFMPFEAPLAAVMFPWTAHLHLALVGFGQVDRYRAATAVVADALIASGLVKSVSLCFFTIFVTAAKTWYKTELPAELEFNGSL